jgi:hypothetical protein
MHSRLIAVLLLAPIASASAQVGYLPTQSPFREIEHGSFLELSSGRVLGTGGPLELGPRNGTALGLRWVVRGKNTLQFSFGAWTAGTKRTQIDPDDSVAVRNKGLIDQRLIGGEINIQFNVTGGKTWHSLAPFAGIGIGLVHGQATPATDTSGYSFGSKVYFAPGIGTRLFAGQRLYLKLDARALFWKLEYPQSYLDEPAKQPGTSGHSNAVNTTGLSSQYTLTPEVRIGIGIVL